MTSEPVLPRIRPEIAALPPATDAVAVLERYARVPRRATATAAPSIAIAPATSAPAT